MRSILVVLLSCIGAFPPQSSCQASAKQAGQSTAQSVASKLTPQQERGLRLLKAAESEAAGLAPDMGAFVLWRASYAYAKVDSRKSESVANDAFTTSLAIENSSDNSSDAQCGSEGSEGDIKSWVQEHVLSAMVQKEQIAKTEELLPQATASVRRQITTKLVKYYLGKNDIARAESFLLELTDSEDYPFDAAADLLLKTRAEQSADRMTVFNQALTNFEQHDNPDRIGGDDFGNFIERTWTHVPSALVLEAIDKVLEQAKAHQSRSHYSMTSAAGGVTLDSAYEFRLFQLLPVLEELDKDKADSLLRDNAGMQARMSKYPQGMKSLGGIQSWGISYDDASPSPSGGAGAPSGAAQQAIEAQVMQRMSEIEKETDKVPSQALGDALGLPVQGPNAKERSPRAQALIEIADAVSRKKPSVAKSALDEIVKIQDQLSPAQMIGLSKVPRIYLDLGDEEGARKVLKALLKAAEKLYGEDTDAEDPNKAFKGNWPSSNLWRRCVQVAAQISPTLADDIISDIPDPEIAATEKAAYASSLLGAESEPFKISECRKKWAGFSASEN